MISLSFSITNPFSDRWKTLFYKTRSNKSETKVVELQTTKNNVVLGFDFGVSCRTDHAGFMLELNLLGYGQILHYYDTRHWDRHVE